MFWTDKELQLLEDNWDTPLKELPAIIGRSYKSISKKMWEMRKKLKSEK